VTDPTSTLEPDLSGSTLDRYHLLRRIGVGGMGSVYEAEHTILRQQLAVKVLRSDLARDEVHRKRFLREARAASSVKHPHVVAITDCGETQAHVFFAMELLEGHDLQDVLDAETRLEWPRTRSIVLQVASALEAAHLKQIVHRDIKPSNCFLADIPGRGEEDFVKVLDFGIAKLSGKLSEGTARLTSTDEVFGTVAYMAPEMALGVSDDPRSDVYAVGVMLYRMLVGELPFSGGTAYQIISQHIQVPPTPPRTKQPTIPEGAEAIILKALAKEPRNRFPSMLAFAQAIRRGSFDATEVLVGTPTEVLTVLPPSSSEPSTSAEPTAQPKVSHTEPTELLRPAPASVIPAATSASSTASASPTDGPKGPSTPRTNAGQAKPKPAPSSPGEPSASPADEIVSLRAPDPPDEPTAGKDTETPAAARPPAAGPQAPTQDPPISPSSTHDPAPPATSTRRPSVEVHRKRPFPLIVVPILGVLATAITFGVIRATSSEEDTVAQAPPIEAAPHQAPLEAKAEPSPAPPASNEPQLEAKLDHPPTEVPRSPDALKLQDPPSNEDPNDPLPLPPQVKQEPTRGQPEDTRGPKPPGPKPKAKPKSDATVIAELKNKLERECKENGDVTVKIEGPITTEGTVVSPIIKPRDGVGICVKALVKKAKFAKGQAMRTMPKFTVDL
jgi:serine/threonine protein kinase